MEDLIRITRQIFNNRYPTANVILLAGSLLRGEGTPYSDLDLVVIFDHLPNAWRESFDFQGYPVEAFVHDPETLNYFLLESCRSSNSPAMARMVLEGVEVPGPSEISRSLKRIAADLIASGPPELNDDDERKLRYTITNLIDDIRQPRSREELIATGAELYGALANYYFRTNGLWPAVNKSIPRAFNKADPELYSRFREGFDQLFAGGRGDKVITLAEEILKKRGGFLFDGYKQDASPTSRKALTMNKQIQQTITPIDGSIYAERELAYGKQIAETLARAVSAQHTWKRVPVAERAALCRRMLDWLLERADQIGEELTWQIGRPIAYSPFEIRRGFQERVNYMAEIAERELADIPIEPKENFQRFIRREPVGVVLVLAPWNYPWLASVNAVVPAILAGNSVILKIAPQTPLVAEAYAEAFKAAGLPEGVFQFLHIDHDQVAVVIRDSRIGFVAFTGSVAGGHAVQRAVGERFIATGLELGGKDPAYVRPDAPMQATIENLVDGAMFNSGQSCCAIERVYVHRDVYDQFIAGFVELTKQYKLGNPLDPATTLGPMVRVDSADKARAHIADALKQGAKALIDPALFPAAREGTPYFAPQVLTQVDHSMLVMTEETFAPVAGIMSVKDDDEAIRLMNDSRYGLTASIWTTDVDAALRIGDQINTGTWYMNRCDYLDPALAWAGVKDSGRGCTLSKLGFEAFTRPKSFHLRLNL